MNTEKGIAPHEAFDLHELLMLKNTSATKCFAMSKLVKNEELKTIMQQGFITAKEQIKELESLIQFSGLASSSSFKPVQTSEFASSSRLNKVKEKEVQPNRNS